MASVFRAPEQKEQDKEQSLELLKQRWAADYDPAAEKQRHQEGDLYINTIIWCKDDDINNLRFSNLERRDKCLGTHQPGSNNLGRRRAKRKLESGISRYRGRWRVQVRHNGKDVYVGMFDTKAEAIVARNDFSLQVETNGRYARPATKRRTAEYSRTSFNPLNQLMWNYWLQPHDPRSTDIWHYDHINTSFNKLSVGDIFWYDGRWWYKTSQHGAYTCDEFINRQSHKFFTPLIRVKRWTSMRRNDRP